MLCLEVWRKRIVKERRVIGRRVEGNYYLSPCLDISKIKGEKNN